MFLDERERIIMLKKLGWYLFLTIEVICILGMMWHFFQYPILFILALINIFLMIYIKKKPYQARRHQLLWGILSIFLLVIFASSIFFWIGLAAAFIFLILFILWYYVPIYYKQLFMIKTKPPKPYDQHDRKKSSLWVTQKIGQEIYEWDDINLYIFLGDTIIDLENTLLPKEDNYIVLRKVIGKTRILVPSEVGVVLDQRTVLGHVYFHHDSFLLRNESLKIYSPNFDQKARRIRIISQITLGDIEVIFI